MTGLHNDVTVVVDPSARGCAYATTVQGEQFIGVNLRCTGRLRTLRKTYDYRTVGILAHEVGHLLSGHTTNQKAANPAEESDADEWSGWGMARLGATLAQALTAARSLSVVGSDTHPGRETRVASVTRGYRKAKEGVAPPRRRRPIGKWWEELMKTPLPWPWPEGAASGK